MKKLALFDFDGTITRSDSMFALLRFLAGTPRYYRGLLAASPAMALHAARLLPAQKAKEALLQSFLAGMPVQAFDERCRQFTAEVLPGIMRPGALQAIDQYKAAGFDIYVVSASAENWVHPWCSQRGLGCIATRLEKKNGLLTGNIEGLNCNGPEKKNRILHTLDIQAYSQVIAFGDSQGDRAMFSLATEQHYRPFR
ncbi:MAG: HAD-IB family hydrolase [Flavihumibacter sp.]